MPEMKNKLYLGIDTSNYTTSAALVTASGEIVANVKEPLPVAEGARGLRQSDALFAHVKNMPSVMERINALRADGEVVAVGVSTRPRNLEGSYMPCFLAGEASATAVSAAVGIPLYRFSHQCGHMMAALRSSGRYDLLTRPFAAYHISGGTTELMLVSLDGDGFSAEHIGGTRDLNAGQVIDRIGVLLGLRFPCGPALEELALQNTEKIPRRRIAREGCFVNLSGLENMAADLYRKTGDSRLVAAFVFECLGNAIADMTAACLEEHGEMPVLFAGGVMSNGILKKRLASCCDAAFSEPALSADNAVGIALLAARKHGQEPFLA